MIRAVDNKRLDLTDEEHSYYLDLLDKFGNKEFCGLFATDKNGQITSISPPLDREVSLGVLFFILNVMMNQRLRKIGELVAGGKKNVAENSDVANLEERLAALEERVQQIFGNEVEEGEDE